MNIGKFTFFCDNLLHALWGFFEHFGKICRFALPFTRNINFTEEIKYSPEYLV